MSDVKVVDEDNFLSRSMMIKGKNTIMKERIWINRVASKTVFQPGIQTMALRYTMSVWNQFAREPYQRDVTDMKGIGEWLSMESRNLVFDSRYLNLFKEFKIARPNAQNVSYRLEVNEFTDFDNQRVYDPVWWV